MGVCEILATFNLSIWWVFGKNLIFKVKWTIFCYCTSIWMGGKFSILFSVDDWMAVVIFCVVVEKKFSMDNSLVLNKECFDMITVVSVWGRLFSQGGSIVWFKW